MVYSIIVHGGAGVIDPAFEVSHTNGCLAAIEAARPILEAGGDALDACCAAVRVLEDDPMFNAGIGSVLDLGGTPAMDAAVMRGPKGAIGETFVVSLDFVMGGIDRGERETVRFRYRRMLGGRIRELSAPAEP